jgi:hypothetical protein
MATTNDINTTNTSDMCNLNTDDHLSSTIEDDTTINKSQNLSDHHTNADTDASNNRPFYTPPPDENTFSDPTDPIDSADYADPYTPPPDDNTFSDPTDPIDSADPNTPTTNDAHDTAHDIYHPPPQTKKAVTSLR